MKNLWTLLRWNIIQRAFKARTSCVECTSSDIILKKLFIDDVDHGWDEGLDVLGIGNKSVHIPYKFVSTLLSRTLQDDTYDC